MSGEMKNAGIPSPFLLSGIVLQNSPFRQWAQNKSIALQSKTHKKGKVQLDYWQSFCSLILLSRRAPFARWSLWDADICSCCWSSLPLWDCCGHSSDSPNSQPAGIPPTSSAMAGWTTLTTEAQRRRATAQRSYVGTQRKWKRPSYCRSREISAGASTFLTSSTSVQLETASRCVAGFSSEPWFWFAELTQFHNNLYNVSYRFNL